MRRLKLSLLRLLKAVGILSLSKALSRNRVRILCYHAAALGDEGKYSPKLFAPTALVAERLQWLLDNGYHGISLQTLVGAIREGKRVDPHAFVVTLDDGWYSSWAHIVKPALTRALPVTLYLASEVAQRQVPVIDVTLGYLFSHARTNEPKIAIILEGMTTTVDLSSHQSRHAAMLEITKVCRQHLDDPARVTNILESVALSLGVNRKKLALDSRRFSYLTATELVEMSDSGCDIQLHGHSHTYPLGDASALKHDVSQCIDFFSHIGLPAGVHYCFPSGEFDDLAEPTLKDLGVLSAVTCIPGSIDPIKIRSPYYLPRFVDGGDVSQIEFEAEMSGLMDGLRRLRSLSFFRN